MLHLSKLNSIVFLALFIEEWLRFDQEVIEKGGEEDVRFIFVWLLCRSRLYVEALSGLSAQLGLLHSMRVLLF